MKQSNRTGVYLREDQIWIDVAITDHNKPEISNEIVQKWQRIINTTARIFNVPAGLIMKITAQKYGSFSDFPY